HMVVLKGGGKGIYWQAMRGAGLCGSDTSQRLRTNGKPCESGLLGSRCHDRASSLACQTTQEKEQGSMSTHDDQDVSLMALDQYIRQVRWLEPLTQEEEAQLLARIERGKHEKRQAQPNAWRLSLAHAARERLVEGYLPWVIHL